MNSHATLPKPSKSLILLALLLSMPLLRIYFSILESNFLIFLMSEPRCSMEPCREIALNLLSQESGSRA